MGDRARSGAARALARQAGSQSGPPARAHQPGPGNWKTADVVYLEDSERYSYSATSDVVALNRYFSGVHQGPYEGWGIVTGDVFTSPSVLKDSVTSLPVSVKQPVGMPTMITESTWVAPMDSAFESPMLISAYSSLSGFDGYF